MRSYIIYILHEILWRLNGERQGEKHIVSMEIRSLIWKFHVGLGSNGMILNSNLQKWMWMCRLDSNGRVYGTDMEFCECNTKSLRP